MKSKKTLSIILLLITVSIYGCKKDRYCVCALPADPETSTTFHETKKKAEKECADKETQLKTQNPDWKCSIQ